jgi:hypothetical protein
MRSILEQGRYALRAMRYAKICVEKLWGGLRYARLRYVNSLCWVCVGEILGKKITPLPKE